MVASYKESQDWSPLLSRVVLVECLHVAVLWRACHAAEVLIITNCLYTVSPWSRTAQWSNISLNTRQLYLEVSTANQKVNLTALSLLSSGQDLIDLIEGAVAATFHRDLRQNQREIS